MIKVDSQAIKENPICVEINNVNRSFCKRSYSMNFGKILRAPILQKICERLLLKLGHVLCKKLFVFIYIQFIYR